MKLRHQRHGLQVVVYVALLVVITVAPFTMFGGRYTGMATAHAATNLNWEYKGFNIAAYNQDELLQSGPILQQLAAAGANSVTFAVTWYTDSTASSQIYRRSATASDDSLIWAIDQARTLGLKVIIKPHIDIESDSRSWRANINPTDVNAWFTNYTTWMAHFADIAKDHGASVLVVGSELITMSTNKANESHWRAMIAEVRKHFDGKLTYSANWGGNDFYEEWSKIPFWDALDYLGISAYFQLTNSYNPSVTELKASWGNWKQKLYTFQQRWNRPMLFTEVGYRNMDGAANSPFDWWSNNQIDNQEQVDCYEALFSSWANVAWFAGSQFWHWSLHPPSDPPTDYPVQNKPAYQTVKAWFTAGGQTPNTTPTLLPTVTPSATPPPTITPTPTNGPVPTPDTAAPSPTPSAEPATPVPTDAPLPAPVPPGMPPLDQTYEVYLPLMNR
ncbi:MAG TPA: hypothetical protein VFT66_14940 [Roseiflexaceae bacterium]|jgi:hypothetical protein|nr:hypothetical protein [Roseiflexaceae bacterium]